MKKDEQICDLKIIAKDDILLSYSFQGIPKVITFSSLLPYWDYATEKAFERGHFDVIDDKYILGIVTTASMQSGIVFLWDMFTDGIIHVSNGSHTISSVIWEDNVYSLRAVSNTNGSFQYQICRFPLDQLDVRRKPNFVFDITSDVPAWDGSFESLRLRVDKGYLYIVDASGENVYCTLLIDGGDEENAEIVMYLSSEKADASIGVGFYCDPEKDQAIFMDTVSIYEGLSESFWENFDDGFYQGIEKAEKLVDEDPTLSFQQALFQVFGHFSIDYWMDDVKINPPCRIGIDSDEEMYFLLMEYVE